MPRERMGWLPVATWGGNINGMLRRLWDLAENSTRWDYKTISATATLDLSWPSTVIEVDTTAGSVTLTLPPLATVPGYRVEVVKTVAANTLTIDGSGAELINGATTLAWTTANDSYSLTALPARWRIT